MVNRGLYAAKMNHLGEGQHREQLQQLMEEIKDLRTELGQKVSLEGTGINNEEVLKVSRMLDALLIKYLRDKTIDTK